MENASMCVLSEGIMDDLDRWLQKECQSEEFQAGLDEEVKLAELAVQVALARQKEGLS